MRNYELMFIVDPEVEGDDLAAVAARVQEYVEREGGTVEKTEPWGMRRLAYPIKKKWEGQYVLMGVTLDPERVSAFERDLRLVEEVLRHLIVLPEE